MGVVAGSALLDLEYVEDVAAEVDMNVVMTGAGRLVEVQATAELVPFDREMFVEMLDMAENGIKEIATEQARMIAASLRPAT